MRKQKMTAQIQICLVEYPSSKVSDPSEVPQIVVKLIFKLVQEVKLNSRELELNLRELDNIVLVRTSNNLVRVRYSSMKVFNILDLRLYCARIALLSVRLPKHQF